MATSFKDNSSPTEGISLTLDDLELEKGLPAMEVDRRLITLAHAHRQIESSLCFYLLEVDERQLYSTYGHASTIDYARERLGFEDRKTYSLLFIARRFKDLPHLKKAFKKGELPWTKAREVAKAAKPETDEEWLKKSQTMSNRQIEKEVRKTLPPVKKEKLVLVLEGEMLEVWKAAREAVEIEVGSTLTNLQVFDVMCAEVLTGYATTPPLGDPSEENGGCAADILERDRYQCTRPGCRCRTGLTGNHIKSRGRGGSDDPSNRHIVCIACHKSIHTGQLKVSGQAPDQIVWEGPFGIIEKPLPPLDSERDEHSEPADGQTCYEENTDMGSSDGRSAREPTVVYEAGTQSDSPDRGSLHFDHVINRRDGSQGAVDAGFLRNSSKSRPGSAVHGPSP
jgi:hypothetical protein